MIRRWAYGSKPCISRSFETTCSTPNFVAGGITVSARPSDAIAVALRCDVAILGADGPRCRGIEIPDEQEDEVEKFREFLDNVSPRTSPREVDCRRYSQLNLRSQAESYGLVSPRVALTATLSRTYRRRGTRPLV